MWFFLLSRFWHNQIHFVRFKVQSKSRAQFEYEEQKQQPNQTYAHNFKFNRQTFSSCYIHIPQKYRIKSGYQVFGEVVKSVYSKSFVGSSKLLDNYLSECVCFRAWSGIVPINFPAFELLLTTILCKRDYFFRHMLYVRLFWDLHHNFMYASYHAVHRLKSEISFHIYDAMDSIRLNFLAIFAKYICSCKCYMEWMQRIKDSTWLGVKTTAWENPNIRWKTCAHAF